MSEINFGWFGRKRAIASQSTRLPTKQPNQRPRRSGIMALEPRMMYDGAGHASASHHGDHHHDHADVSPGGAPMQAPAVGAPAAAATPRADGHAFGSQAGDWSKSTGVASSEPMPHVTTWVKNPTEIVFIDPQAPDYQILASGVKPGIEVVVLDPNSDGVEQISNFLKRHPDPNLTTIDIVAHGQDGMLFLGNAVLDNATVGQYAAQLKTIGAAMQPGGDLMLYGCDVAADPSGLALLAQISDETGVNVAAATADVGSAAKGGTWSLTATSGPIKATAPFTAAALAAYPDLLNADLFVTGNASGAGSIFVDQNGTVSSVSLGTPFPQQIVLDTVDGLYFVIDNEDSGARIYEGQISQALAGNGTLHTIFTDTTQANGFAADIIAGVQVDSVHHLLYFVDNKNNNVSSAQETSLFERITYSTTPLTADTNASATILGTVPNGGNFRGGVAGFAMDFANPAAAQAVFAVNVGGTNSFGQIAPGSATLYTASLTASAGANSVTIAAVPNLTIPATEGFFPNSVDGSLAIDDHNGAPIVYFALDEGHNSNGSLSTTSLGLYSYQLGSSATTPTVIFQGGNPANGVGPTPALDGITIDTVTGKYYSTGVAQPTGATSPQFGVYVGSLTSHNVPTLDADFSTVLPTGGNPAATGVAVDDVALSATNGASTYVAGGAAVTVDGGVTVSHSEGANLASATVSITTHFQSGDVLGIPAGDLTAGKVTGTNITESYNSTTGVLTLSGVDTIAHYQMALQEVTFSSTLAAPSTSARTITFLANDGVVSGTATDTVNIHDAPVVTAGASATFNGGGSAAHLDSGLTVTDLSSGTLASATVSIGTGFISGDTLNFTNQNGISGSYNSSTGVLTLSGTASTTNYQTALESITYSFTSGGDPTGGGTHTARTINWVANDGTLNSTTATSSLTTVHVAPTVTPSGATASFTGGGAAVVLDSGITANDVDSGGNLSGATVSIGTGFLAGDTLNFTNQNGITGSYVAATGVLTLSGSATLANYKTALESITYSFTAGGDPTSGGSDTARSISWTVTDGSTSNGTSTAKTSTLNTVHVAPTVTAGASATYNAGGSAALLDSTLTVADVDSGGNLHGATVSIGTGFVIGDVLNFTAQSGITASYTAATGVLTLSGTASLATYQAELDSVTFSTSATTAGSRTINWVVSDGSTSHGTSATATSTVAVQTGPQISGTGTTVNYQENGAAVSIDTGLTVTDPSGANITGATATINGFVSGDVLAIPAADLTGNTFNGTGITVSYNSANGVLSLSGSDTAAHYQNVLDTITYSFSANPITAGTVRTVSYAVTDANSITSAAGATNTVDLIHVAPVVTAGATATFTGGGAAVTLDGALTLSDADSGGNLAGATVSIGGFISGDTLNFTNQNGISLLSNSGGVLTLTGTATVAQYQTALDSITYSFTNGGDPTGGGTHTTRTISWSVIDGSANNGTSNTATSTLTTVHVAPSVTAGATASFTGGGAAVALDGALTVSDVDSGGNLTGATVTIGTGFISGDTLNFTNQNGISVLSNSGGVLTLTGTATVLQYQAALDSITYSFTANGDPTGGGADTARTINWSVTDGSTSHGSSNTASSTLTTVHVAPVVTPSGATASFTGGGSAVALDGALTLSDVDSGGNLTGATVTIGASFISGDTLNFTNQNGISVLSNSGGVLTLTGTATVLQYQAALDSITYSFTANGDPTAGGTDTARTISWTVTDGSTSNGTSNTATSTLDTVHVAPSVTAGATATFTGGGAAVALDGALTVSDVDSGGNLTGATVTIGTGFISGDTLNFTNQNGISGSYNAATGMLSLSGTASVANYQTALDSITYSFTANGDPTGGGTDTARTINWSVTDGSSSHGSSNTATSTLTTVHVAPVVTAGASASFTGGGSAVALDGALSVSDVDSGGNLASATVSIGTGFITGDILNFTNQNGITGHYDAATGMLSLSGTASVANYQTALDSITYSFSPANGDPTDAARTINWSVTDGSTSNGTSNTATSTLDTVHVAPTVSAGATATFETGSPTAVTLDGALTVSDVDSGGNLTGATVSISSGFLSGDTLNFTDQNGISVVSNSGGILTLTGTATVAQYQTALESISFTSTSTSLTPRTIDWSVNDGSSTNGSSAVAHSTVNVINGPLVSAGATVTYTQGGGVVALDPALTITDPVTTTLASATVSIGTGFVPNSDTLNFTNQSNITGSYDAGTGVLTLSGVDTVADYQTALESISYGFSPANGDPTVGATDTSRTINWSVNDGRVSSATATSTVDTAQSTTAATALVVTSSGNTATFDQGGSAVLIDHGIVVTDSTNPTDTVTSATVTISANFQSGDVLGFDAADLTGHTINGTSITESYSSTGVLTLSGPDTLADYQTALGEVTFSSTAAPLSIVPRSVTFSATDGTVSGSAIETVDIHDQPVVTVGTPSVSFTGGGSPTTLDSGLTLSDPSGTTLTHATVTIGAGLQAGDVLSFNNGTNTETFTGGDGKTITGSYDSGSGTLTLSGTASVADYQTALQQVQFSFTANGDPTNGGGDTSRGITWQVNDGVSLSSTTGATTTLDVAHAPPVVTASGTVTFDGGSATAVTLDSGLMVSDVDSGGNLTSATVSIGGFVNGDTLSVGTAGGLTVAYDSASGTLSLTGTASLSTYQTALDSITYSFTNGSDPTAGGTHTARTISWSVTDASTSNGTSNTATSTLDTVHVAPTVTPSGTTATFTGGGSAVALDGALTVNDVDSGGNLTSATVSIGGFVIGDTLSVGTAGGLTVAYDSASGILTLTGSASLTTYQTALESITYNFTTGGDPTAGGADTTRSISWSVTDGSTSHGTSNTATSTLDTVHVAPTVTASGTATFTGGSATPVTLDSGLTVSDADSGGNLTSATVSIGTGFISGDTLNFTNQSGITGSYNSSTGVLTLSGTASVANYQTALDSITYNSSPTNGDPTGGVADVTRSISWSVTDGSTSNGSSNTATSTLDTVHVAPSVTAGGTVTFTGGSATPVALDGALTVNDVDSGGNLTSATVSIGGFVSGDTLSVGTAGGLTVAYDSASGTLSLTGTASLTIYQMALDSITYSFTNGGDPTAGGTHTTRTIDWSVTDGSTSNGSSNTATSTLDTVHVAPTVTPSGTTATFTGGGSAAALDGALTVNDVDSGGNLTSATVSIGGFVNGDTLSVGTAGGLTVAYDSASGTLSLTGTASLSTYQTALDSITYGFTNGGDPTAGGTHTARTISWSVTDASTSNGTSNTATTTLDVTHAPPTLTTGGTVTYIQAGTPAQLDGTLSLSDPDSGGLLSSATVQITSGLLSGDTLSADTTGHPSITATYDSSTGELTLGGSDTLADYLAVLKSVTFSSTSGNPTSDGADPSRTVTWTINDGVSSNPITQTSAIDVHAIPAVVAGGTATFDGGGSAQPLDGALTVKDTSSTTLASATVSIGAGFINGDTLNFTNQSGITGSYDAVHGVLTLNGTASTANYQAALESVSYSFTANGDPTNGGVDTARTISWTVNDGTAGSTAATSTLNTVHLAPTATPSGATATFDGGGSPVPVDGGLTVNDIDSGGNLNGATVTISGGFLNGDTLAVDSTVLSTTHITAFYDAANHDLVLSGSDTLANYQTVLQAVTYSFNPANGDPTGGGGDTARTISWVVKDASTSNGSSAAATSALDTVHVPPVVAAGGAAAFEIGGTAVPLDSTLTVSDADSLGNLTGATVSIGTGFSANDVLNFTNQHNITGSYNSATGVLTLAGTDTVADYQAALDSITFRTTSTAVGSRSFGWTVSDGTTSSAQASSTMIVESGPQVTAGGTATFTGGGVAVPLDSALTVVDQSNLDLQSAKVSIGTGFITGDTLNFTNQNGITGSYDAVHGVLSLTGTASAADYQAALDSVTYSYSPTNGDPTAGGGDTLRTVSWVASDSAPNSTPATSTLDVVHAPPVVTVGTPNTTFTGGGSATTLDSGLLVSDADSSGKLTGATVTIGGGLQSGDVLSFNSGTNTETFAGDGKTITGSYNSSTGVLTLSGSASVADYQAALDQVQFSFNPANGDPTAGGTATSRGITWQVNDGVSLSSTTGAGATTLQVVHAPPVVTVGTPNTTFTGGGSATTLDSGLLVSDADSSGKLTGATVTIGGGLQSGDVLSFNSGTNTETFAGDGKTITGSYNSSTGVLTLSGSASVADYQAALDQVQFSFNPANGDPTAGGTNRGITWQVNDGVSLSSTTGATTALSAVHVAPTVTPSGATASFDGRTAVALDGGLTVSDPDSGGNLAGATVSIGAGFLFGDTLNFTNQGGIAGSYNAATGVLTLSGTASVASYQTALDSITYSFSPTNGDPTGGTAHDTSRTISWVLNDGATTNGSNAPATSTLEVKANLAPPPPSGQLQVPVVTNFDHGHFGDFSGMVTNASVPSGFSGLSGFSGFDTGGAIHVIHSDVVVSIGDNGNIAFNLPLEPFEAELDGDVVSVTASLPDGKPLPAWLQFNAETGKFAGLVPDDILTGSIRPDGGIVSRPDSAVLPQSITIEVIARDSHGNISIMDFTIDLTVKTLHKADKHGWNVLPGGLDPWGQIQPRRDLAGNSGDGLHRDIALPVTADHVLWHDGAAIDIARARSLQATDLTPAGRAGLSEQLKTHGWRAASAERMALLESLRQVATSSW
jgi:large repetitive protein